MQFSSNVSCNFCFIKYFYYIRLLFLIRIIHLLSKNDYDKI